MKGASSINTIIVSGGTHGNELTGIKPYEKWSAHPEAFHARKCPSANSRSCIRTSKAQDSAAVKVDLDLNRSFSAELPRSKATRTTMKSAARRN